MPVIEIKGICVFVKHCLSLMCPTDLFFIFNSAKMCAGGGEPVCNSLSNSASWRHPLYSSDRRWDSIRVGPAATGTRSVGPDLGASPARSHSREVTRFHRQMETQIQGDKKNDFGKFISYCGKTVSNWMFYKLQVFMGWNKMPVLKII